MQIPRDRKNLQSSTLAIFSFQWNNFSTYLRHRSKISCFPRFRRVYQDGQHRPVRMQTYRTPMNEINFSTVLRLYRVISSFQ